jgi:glycosyltransferase involved in cell wall biosynthesis
MYVQSSRYEGMSRALMEAMSMGRAIAATSVDGTLDLAQDGTNMLLCRPDDAHSLSLAIATLAEKPELRTSIANQARVTAKQFGVEKMVQRLQNLYGEL